MNNLAVFLHLHQVNNWEEIYRELIGEIIASGLSESLDHIHVGVNGYKSLPEIYKVNSIERNQHNHLESDTLYTLYQYCLNNPESRVLYLHAKGVTWHNSDLKPYVDSWRKYLSYFVIHNWKLCVEKLKEYDCVGTEWINDSLLGVRKVRELMKELNYNYTGHYSGNFWWANAKYISTLDPNFIFEENGYTRFKGEFWIGTQNPKHFNFYNIKREDTQTLYEINISESEYGGVV